MLGGDPLLPSGAGLTEGPRGALGHWLDIEAGVVSHYGVVAPTTWNASPRDQQEIPGPFERALCRSLRNPSATVKPSTSATGQARSAMANAKVAP